jgi:hypothetical protein
LLRCSSGEKWRTLISHCISLMLLVNGSPSGFFGSSPGLRQEDPWSPLLFIIVKEALSKMIAAVIGSFLSGFFCGV